MFNKILVPTDFSDDADRMLRFVVGLKQHGLAEIVLAHVVDIGRTASLPVREDVQAAIAGKLSERAEQLRVDGFRVKTVILEGRSADELMTLAVGERVTLIVSGSSGKSLAEEVWQGSISERLGRSAPVPVLLIRYDTLKKVEDTRPLFKYATETFNKVLLPLDFTPATVAAVEFTKQLKKAGVSDVVMLHVVNTKQAETELDELEIFKEAKRKSARIESELKESRLNTKSYFQIGDPLEEIASIAESENVSLIVMGTHGKGLIQEWLEGSVSLDVVRTIDRPALLVQG